MRLGRRHHKQEEAQVDLTSMLDIVFIMLIFFIVTSSFVRSLGLKLIVRRPAVPLARKMRVSLSQLLLLTIYT